MEKSMDGGNEKTLFMSPRALGVPPEFFVPEKLIVKKNFFIVFSFS